MISEVRGLPTQGTVALHATVSGTAKHRTNNAAAHQDDSHVAAVRLLDILLKQVGSIVADQVAQVSQVVFVPRQEHSLA